MCDATTQSIREKVSDYALPILKSLYEYHGEVKSIQIHFVNNGAGASVAFPAEQRQQRQPNRTYTSIGCEWMRQSNPLRLFDSIGTREQIDKCKPNGTAVSYDDSNALEQEW